jgi:hypothetical protein
LPAGLDIVIGGMLDHGDIFGVRFANDATRYAKDQRARRNHFAFRNDGPSADDRMSSDFSSVEHDSPYSDQDIVLDFCPMNNRTVSDGDAISDATWEAGIAVQASQILHICAFSDPNRS